MFKSLSVMALLFSSSLVLAKVVVPLETAAKLVHNLSEGQLIQIKKTIGSGDPWAATPYYVIVLATGEEIQPDSNNKVVIMNAVCNLTKTFDAYTGYCIAK